MEVKGNVRHQYLAAIFVNIVSISFGAYCGWPSSSFVELRREDSPLETGPLSDQDQGNVASTLCLGGMVGNVFFIWLADRIGRKNSMLWVALPSLLGWMGIPFARNPMHLIAARFLGGMAGGACFGLIPIYTAELAEDSMRGILGTLLVLTCNFGVLLAFILGYYLDYSMMAWVLSGLTALYMVCFWFMPETPVYLAQRHKLQEAEHALRYYRNIRSRPSKELSTELQLELHRLRATEKTDQMDDKADDSAVTWSDFADPQTRKAILIGLGLLMTNQSCGCFALLNYTATIFELSGSMITPVVASIIVGFIQLVGSYVSTLLVERAGRKLLLLISAVGILVGQLTMASHSYLRVLGYDTSSFDWLPVVAFSFMLFIASWGVLTLPFLVISEIMPPKLRSSIIMVLMSVLWLISMLAIKLVPLMFASWGLHGTVLTFACLTTVGILFLAICVPETKGKSIEAILASL